jgi:hypothetical protein
MIAAVSLASVGVTMSRDVGVAPTHEVQSQRSKKAIKRLRSAEAAPRRHRSRGLPPKRKLHRNMVRHGRRVRRKHRRAA